MDAQKVFASTDINSDVTSDTTWDMTGSPYSVSGKINIPAGTTLTISPGVVVLFDYGSEIDVAGSIVSNGTADNNINVTSISDDTLNGQTDDDTDSDLDVPPGAGDYAGFVFSASSTGTFSNTKISYADLAISGTDSSLSITDSTFSNDNASVSVIGDSLTLSNNTFSNGLVPVSIDYSTNFTHSANTFSGNLDDGIGMTGDTYGHDYTFTGGDAPYILFSDLFFGTGNTLTIMPGATLQSDYGNSITINGGNFSSVGTSDAKIVFDNISLQVLDNATATFENTEIKDVQGIALLAYNNAVLDMNNSLVDSIDGSGIYVIGSVLDFKNSTISNFGTNSTAITIFNDASTTIENSTIDTGGDGIVASNHATIDADHLIIKNCNDVGIVGYGSDGYDDNGITVHNSEITENNVGVFPLNHTNVDISKNSIHDNSSFGVLSNSGTVYDFSNNWWGDASGPQNAATNPDGKGDAVSDGITFTPWTKHDPAIPQKTPVLIVPGVLGTEISKPNDDGSLSKLWLDLAHNFSDIGDGFMDPLQFKDDLTPTDSSLVLGDVLGKTTINLIAAQEEVFDYSDSLTKEFKNQGYTEGTDLFTFPYDWRYGVSDDTVAQLKQKITDIMNGTGSDKVDVVAHSTGGLLVKKYVMDNPGSNNIEKAVFVGVPSTGAPKAIKTLLMGDNFSNLFLADSEMQKLARNLPVVYDLAPSAEYYKNAGSFVKIVNHNLLSSTKKDLSFDDMTNFLTVDHNFNALAWNNAQNLHTTDFDDYDMRTAGVDLYAIDGCKTGTITKIGENHSDNPLVNLLTPTYSVYKEDTGDGPVPLESSSNLPINDTQKYYALKASHGEMLSENGIRQQIVNIISGSSTNVDSDLITQDISKCNLNGRAISIYSPLSIDITDQNGNHSGITSDGSSIENNIPNADYEILGEHKYVYLPTDSGQTYSIKVAGTGDGVFTLTDATIANNQTTGMQVFNQIPVTTALEGNVNIGNTTTLSLDTNGDGMIDQTLQPTAILDADDAQNFDPEDFGNSLKNNITIASGPQASHTSGGYTGFISQASSTASSSTVVIPDLIGNPGIASDSVPEKQEIGYNKTVVLKEVNCVSCHSGLHSESTSSKNISVSSTLVATVQGSEVPVNPVVIFGSLLGLSGLVLISKKFIK